MTSLMMYLQLQNPQPPAPAAGAGPIEKRLLSSFEFWLSLEVLVFGAIVVGVEYVLLRSKRVRPEDTLRVYGVTLIIIGTLFAITAGFDGNQIAPALGLFGTIAGYLLGRKPPSEEPRNDE